MSEQIVSDIKFEIEQIDKLLETYTDLLAKAQTGKPDLVETTAIGSVLHSFYNGLENVFLAIAKGIDRNVSAGSQWHRDLLNQMAQSTTRRKAILSASTAESLTDYLSFRHFFRHSYSFYLDWEELEELVTPLVDI
ncbi:MAG: antitoxin [Chloroflexi bacterium]|nr:antitoxin [Chloroflexota bacterium]